MTSDGPSAGPMDPLALEALRHQSGVSLGDDGVFSYRGRSVENDRVQALFHRGIDVREDGKVTLTVGRFMAYPEVVGVARFVRTLAWQADGSGHATLAGGREIELAGVTIGYASDDRFYLWFPGLRGPARALRDAHQALAGRVGDDPEGLGQSVCWLAAIPRPDAPAPRPAATDAGPELGA